MNILTKNLTTARTEQKTITKSDIGLSNVTNEAQIAKSIVTTKGDIITATGNATPARQGVGNNGQIIVADDNLTNGLGYKDPAFRNWVINGNMEVSQRGTSFTNPIGNSYTIDRYRVTSAADGGVLPNIVYSQQIITPGELDKSKYFYRINVDGSGSSFGDNSYSIVRQYIENGCALLCGNNKKITISFDARSSIVNKKIGVCASQFYGSGGTPSTTEVLIGNHWTLSSSWETYQYTINTNTLEGKTFGTDNNDYILLFFFIQWGSNFAERNGDTVAETFVGAGNIDIAQVALYAGDVAYPFEPIPFDMELQRCMRFCQKLNYNEMRMRAYLISTNEIHFCYPISEMRIKPTASLIGTANTDYLVYATNGNPQSGFTFDINSYTNKKMCYIIATKNNHGLSDAFLMISTNGSALFDADF